MNLEREGSKTRENHKMGGENVNLEAEGSKTRENDKKRRDREIVEGKEKVKPREAGEKITTRGPENGGGETPTTI